MPATAPMDWTRGSVSSQRIKLLPGPRALRRTPVTITAKDSGLLPLKTVHTSPFMPGCSSSIGRTGAFSGWAANRIASNASRTERRRKFVTDRMITAEAGGSLEGLNWRCDDFASPVNRGALVGCAQEPRLVGAGRQVDTVREAAMEKTTE